MVSRFNPDAAFLSEATAFERIQLEAMARIIEAKVAELLALREQRDMLSKRIGARKAAKERLGQDWPARRVW
jgi:hypothetical protein